MSCRRTRPWDRLAGLVTSPSNGRRKAGRWCSAAVQAPDTLSPIWRPGVLHDLLVGLVGGGCAPSRSWAGRTVIRLAIRGGWAPYPSWPGSAGCTAGTTSTATSTGWPNPRQSHPIGPTSTRYRVGTLWICYGRGCRFRRARKPPHRLVAALALASGIAYSKVLKAHGLSATSSAVPDVGLVVVFGGMLSGLATASARHLPALEPVGS